MSEFVITTERDEYFGQGSSSRKPGATSHVTIRDRALAQTSKMSYDAESTAVRERFPGVSRFGSETCNV